MINLGWVVWEEGYGKPGFGGLGMRLYDKPGIGGLEMRLC